MTPVAKGAGRAALAVGVALTAATWAHALSGFGGAATDELFARWIYDAIILAAAFTRQPASAMALTTAPNRMRSQTV